MPKQATLPSKPIPNTKNNNQIFALTYEEEQDNTVALGAIDIYKIQLRSRKKLYEPAPLIITETQDYEDISISE